MGNELSLVNQNEIGIMDLGNVLSKSGYFSDARDAAQAIVKVLAGRELGFGPIASMTGFYIVKGKISMSANLMGAAVKRSGKYDYTITKLDMTQCIIMFWGRNPKSGEFAEIGESVFTAEDAKQAGLAGDNWTKYKRNMLFARAMSNGVKWYCPDVTGGPVYTPDELGYNVDGETGEVLPSAKVDHGPQWTEQPKLPSDGKPLPTTLAEAYKQGAQDGEAMAKPVSWPTEVIDWAVSEWDIRSFGVVAALKQSKLLTPADSVDIIKHWLQIRKVERDNGVESVEATARADAGLQAIRESDGDDEPNPYRDGAEHA